MIKGRILNTSQEYPGNIYSDRERATTAEDELRASLTQETADRIASYESITGHWACRLGIAQDSESGLVTFVLYNDLGDVLDTQVLDLDTEHIIKSAVLIYDNKLIQFTLADGSIINCDLSPLINDMNSRFAAEINRATLAENAINLKIDQEVARASAEDNTLHQAITNEYIRASGAEQVISNNLAAEATTRSTEDQELRRLGNVETQNRAAADTSLGNQISAEATARQAADNAISNRIDALDMPQTGGDGTYIKYIKQENGQVSVIVDNTDTTPTEDSAKPITSGGVKAAIDAAAAGNTQYVDEQIATLDVGPIVIPPTDSIRVISETNGKINIQTQPIAIDATQVTGLADTLDSITSKIPAEASATNQLADKAFVNSSIATSTATFKGTYDEIKYFPVQDVDENDYVFLQVYDSTTGLVKQYDRYKYSSNATTKNWKIDLAQISWQWDAATYTWKSQAPLTNIQLTGINYSSDNYMAVTPEVAESQTQANVIAVATDGTIIVNTDSTTQRPVGYLYYVLRNAHQGAWVFEYTLNNSSFTEEQWAAINSGVSVDRLEGIDSHIDEVNTRIDNLNAPQVGGDGTYIKYVSESAGIVSAITDTLAIAPAANNQKPISAAGVYQHTSDHGNPHVVTKIQVGLGNVDNTSDLEKPVSELQQAAIDAGVARAAIYTEEYSGRVDTISVEHVNIPRVDKNVNIDLEDFSIRVDPYSEYVTPEGEQSIIEIVDNILESRVLTPAEVAEIYQSID